MTKRLCKLSGRDIRTKFPEISRSVEQAKFVCGSCARSANNHKSLCKPVALQVGKKNKSQPRVKAEASIEDRDTTYYDPKRVQNTVLKAKALKQARETQTRSLLECDISAGDELGVSQVQPVLADRFVISHQPELPSTGINIEQAFALLTSPVVNKSQLKQATQALKDQKKQHKIVKSLLKKQHKLYKKQRKLAKQEMKLLAKEAKLAKQERKLGRIAAGLETYPPVLMSPLLTAKQSPLH